jgi:hypothetical protein
VTTRLGWSARSFHRVLRVARTVADLEGHASITTSHLGEAIQYRRAPARGRPRTALYSSGASARSASTLLAFSLGPALQLIGPDASC